MSATAAAPPAPANTAPMAWALARSPAQPAHDWVASPTSSERLRETAASGRPAALIPTDSAAPAAAPATAGRRAGRRSSAGGPGRPDTSQASSPASSARPARAIARCGRRNARARSSSPSLK